LPEIELAARQRGLSLGLVGELPALTLGGFIDAGLPGFPDPFADPVRGGVCGLEARGPLAQFRLLPAPRRAVGPDLGALCVGAGGHIAQVQSASLALVRRDAVRPHAAAAMSSALSSSESTAWELVLAAFRPA
jgi:alkyldihydroxyacetonephosphate synthase